jgi:hypothetical protein
MMPKTVVAPRHESDRDQFSVTSCRISSILRCKWRHNLTTN